MFSRWWEAHLLELLLSAFFFLALALVALGAYVWEKMKGK